MQNLKEIYNYAIKKKKHQLSKLERHYSKSLFDIKNYINNQKDDSAVGLKMLNLSTWYQWNFIYDFISKNKITIENLIQSTYYGLESNNWDFFLGEKFEKYDEAIQFHRAISHMSQALLLGWDKLGIKYGKMLIKMLYGKQYKGWHPAYKHPWFMLEIFCKWQNIQLDYTELNYPEDMGIYQEVINNWDTKSPNMLSQLVNRMVEFHIEESDEYEYEDRTPDFPSSDYFIYAVEILLWLNIRERMGLPDYLPDNELMKMPINNWHTQKTEIPVIELIEKAKSKLVKDYPGIEFEI
ncbi:MAG: hypothetical protein LBG96_07555 [Tannerella sp.]|jgi:hypothetical protein|nr:hypothetical protein [Tannerella sp.]